MASETNTRFHIGTCGYSYPGESPNGWRGCFIRSAAKYALTSGSFTRLIFNSVEINSTFYRPASVAMARGWATKTPADFVFTVKAWQKFTHAAKLADGAHDTGERWPPVERADSERFSEGVASLVEAGRLGALLFQLSGRKSSPPYRKVKTARRQLAAVEILRVLQQPRARASSRQWVDVAGGFAIGRPVQSAGVHDRGISRDDQLRNG